MAGKGDDGEVGSDTGSGGWHDGEDKLLLGFGCAHGALWVLAMRRGDARGPTVTGGDDGERKVAMRLGLSEVGATTSSGQN